MSFFNLRGKQPQKTSVTGARITVKDHGTWSVTAAAAYRRIAITASQLEYNVQKNESDVSMLAGAIAYSIAAKIAYGCAIVNVDNAIWQVLDNDRLSIVFDANDKVVGFEYRNLSGHPLPVTNFLYSMHSAPGRVMAGALHDALEDIKAENMTQAVAATLAENLSYIGLVAYVRGETDPKKLQRIAEQISAAFTGDDRGGVLAVSDNVRIENLLNVTSLNPIGAESLRASRQAIAAAFGVPYDLLYSDSSNRASVDSAKDLLFRDTIVPAAKTVVADFGNTSKFGRIELTEKSLMLGQVPSATTGQTATIDASKAADIKPTIQEVKSGVV